MNKLYSHMLCILICPLSKIHKDLNEVREQTTILGLVLIHTFIDLLAV